MRKILVPLYMVSALAVRFFIGSLSGSLFNGTQAASPEDAVAQSFYLESFEDFPEASMSEAYFTLASDMTGGEGENP
jgi:hypothetical protein